MKPHSITRRLIAWLALFIAMFWIMAAGLGAYVMHDEFGEIFDSSMEETAERLMPVVVDDLASNATTTMPRRMEDLGDDADDHLDYQARDTSGRVLLHSTDAAAAPFKAPLMPGFWEDGSVRVLTTVSADGKLFLQAADNLSHRTEATKEGALALLLPMLVLIPLSIGAMLLIVRRATAPLARLRRDIAGKDGGNLTPVPVHDLPRELLPIARSINLLLARLNAALSVEREFTANSAHELRTPIAGALAQMQLLMVELQQPETRERAGLIEQSLRRLSTLIEKLLQLSRADAGIGIQEAPYDLVPLVDMIVDEFRHRPGPSRPIELIIKGDAQLHHAINPDAFAIVLRNLVENALEHGEKDTPVVIEIDAAGRIIVSNRARFFEANEIEQFRKRFIRGSSASPGSGLGLSIVDRLLAQIGATLELQSKPRADGAVFEAIVTFQP
jgi:two-component system OmpR family sensor kinase